MASQNKGGVMYVYKLDTGGRRPDSGQPPATMKKPNWGSLRRSKTYKEVKNDDDGDVKRENIVGVLERVEMGRKSSASILDGRKSSASVLDGRKSSASVLEGRKSVSSVEANVTEFLQVKVLVTDMPGFMQVHAFQCARKTYDNLDKLSAKTIAFNMKKEFDKVYGPAWHCIVGASFGSYVTHSTGGFLYFTMDKLYILIFKTKVQKSLH